MEKISIPWELGNNLCENPVIETLRSPEFWRGFLRARTNTLIEYRKFKSRFTAAEIELSRQYTAHVIDDTEMFTITINYKHDPIFEICGKWKYCTDSNSAYCGMKTGIGEWMLEYKSSSGFRDENRNIILNFVECAKASDKLGLPKSIFL